MSFVDVIAKKRDGRALSRADIDLFVHGLTTDSIPDYQASALLMAIVLRGMTSEETGWLTMAMAGSGERIDLSDIPGSKVGKHSTGGVGDKVSIVLAPLVAACGVIVPKMSGRGLGHTGGTLDKLESIPGYRINLTIAEFKQVLRSVGTSIIGQTSALAPADKRLYALRDVTATIESLPLIASSIMSKKLAEGSDALLLDVKCGDGAFMKTVDGARALAEAMVAIGSHSGVRTQAVITDMDAPLGRAVGNALEIIECLAALQGQGPAVLSDVVHRLAVQMVLLGGIESDAAAASNRVQTALATGLALQTFIRMVEAHGGNPRIADDHGLLPTVSGRAVCRASRSGFIVSMAAAAIGRASNALGAGRTVVGAAVDHGAGLLLLAAPGDEVREGQPLLELHHRDGRGLDAALELCRSAIVIGDARPQPRDTILADVG